MGEGVNLGVHGKILVLEIY